MILSPSIDINKTGTTAAGSMYSSERDDTSSGVLFFTILRGPATTNSSIQYPTWLAEAKCTCASPAGQSENVFVESIAEAVMEIRRLSGLTWDELGDLFDVSRRSVHHWANGNSVSAQHDRTIRMMLAAIRQINQGEQAHTRALLLSVEENSADTAFDLLKNGQFEEAIARVMGIRAARSVRASLIRKKRDKHRLPPPVLFLDAEYDRPDIPAKARAFRPSNRQTRQSDD